MGDCAGFPLDAVAVAVVVAVAVGDGVLDRTDPNTAGDAGDAGTGASGPNTAPIAGI